MVICRIAGRPIAIDVESVGEVVRAAETVAVGAADQQTLGYLNVRGTHVPAVDGARALGLNARPMQPSDRFVILECPTGRVAILVDEVTSIADVVPIGGPDGSTGDERGARLTAAGNIPAQGNTAVGIIDCDRLGRIAQAS